MTIKLPRVSVIIPTFNRSSLIGASVLSVIAQTFTDWELIVADDGSTDDTAETIRALGDERIRILVLPHRGQAAAPRNAAAAAARGEWLAFLDSDDIWLPEKLAMHMAALEASGADWSYGDHDLLRRNGLVTPIGSGRFVARNGAILQDLIEETTAAFIGTIIVKKVLFEALHGFDEALRLYEDLDFALRLASAGQAIAVAKALTLVRDHDDRTTRKVSAPFDHAVTVFDRLIQRSDSRMIIRLAQKRRRSLILSGTRWHLSHGQWLTALRLLDRLCRFSPVSHYAAKR